MRHKSRRTEATDTEEPAPTSRPRSRQTRRLLRSETTESEDAATPESREPVLVPHRPAGKRLKIAAAAAAALFVAGGAFLGATAQPVIANRALVETKLNVARTAANAITTLWSYTPENMDSLGDRSARYLTGDFAFQYRKFIDSIVATNKQAQVTNTTSVLGTAVEVGQSDGGVRRRVHEFGCDEPGVEEHSVAAVPVVPAGDEARPIRLAHHPDDDDHHAGSHPADVGQAPCPSLLRSPIG